MTELDRATLDRVLPPSAAPADWDDVLRRSGGVRGRRRAGLLALVVAALVVAGTASALGTVRAFFLGTGVNSKIAVMHNTRKNCCPHELWIMNADGSNPVRVARDVDGGRPSWSPDERQIAYSRSWRGNQIYVVRPDGSGRRLLTRRGFDPQWSPDGRRIVFVSSRDGNHEIYVMNADGSDQRNVTGDPGHDVFPVWSPDGRRIAFMSAGDGNPGIYVVNADGSDKRNVTRDSWSPPAWSPDGRRIAFTSRRSGVWELHVMNADGSGRRNLRVRTGRDTGLGWSPDGRKIAFTAGSTEVYVVNADGSGRRQLTRSPFANWFAGWSPGPRKGT